MTRAKWTVFVETIGADGATERFEIAILERDLASPTADGLGLRLAEANDLLLKLQSVLAQSSPASERGGADVPLRIKTRAARLSQPPGRDAVWPGHAASAAMATLRMRALRGGAEHRPDLSPKPDIGADRKPSHT